MRVKPCWSCGAPPRCERCGSTERRPNNKGCAECDRRAQTLYRQRNKHRERQQVTYPGLVRAEALAFARLERDDFADVKVTSAARVYIAAFTEFLRAQVSGDSGRACAAEVVKEAALERMHDDRGKGAQDG